MTRAPGTPGVVDRLLDVAAAPGFDEVMGQLRELRLAHPAGGALEGLADLAMQVGAAGGAELGVEGLADEGVHEAVAARRPRDLDQDPRSHRLLESLEQALAREIAHPLEPVARAPPANDRRHPERP